jgi:hypothetical protein
LNELPIFEGVLVNTEMTFFKSFLTFEDELVELFYFEGFCLVYFAFLLSISIPLA